MSQRPGPYGTWPRGILKKPPPVRRGPSGEDSDVSEDEGVGSEQGYARCQLCGADKEGSPNGPWGGSGDTDPNSDSSALICPECRRVMTAEVDPQPPSASTEEAGSGGGGPRRRSSQGVWSRLRGPLSTVISRRETIKLPPGDDGGGRLIRYKRAGPAVHMEVPVSLGWRANEVNPAGSRAFTCGGIMVPPLSAVWGQSEPSAVTLPPEHYDRLDLGRCRWEEYEVGAPPGGDSLHLPWARAAWLLFMLAAAAAAAYWWYTCLWLASTRPHKQPPP